MCIIAVKPKNKPIFSDETIETMYERNPHGAGIMFLKPDGNVHIEKGFFSAKDVLDYVHARPELKDTDVVMHFRIATSGKRDGLGCHPYPVWSNNLHTSADVSLAMCHNGVLDSYGWKGTPEINDTQVFIKNCLRRLPHNFLRNRGIIDLLHKSTGTNKFAFLDKEGIHTIGEFFKDGGYLFSNTSYKPGPRLTDSGVYTPLIAHPVKSLSVVSASKLVRVEQRSKEESDGHKQEALSKLRLEGIDFDRKLSESAYEKLSKWVIRYASYIKQDYNKDILFEDSEYRYVFKSRQRCIRRSRRFTLKDLQSEMDDCFNGFVGEVSLIKERYFDLKSACSELMRKDYTITGIDNSFYDDDYYYIFNDDELSVCRYSLYDDRGTEWF